LTKDISCIEIALEVNWIGSELDRICAECRLWQRNSPAPP
jgi:hypothetical protein